MKLGTTSEGVLDVLLPYACELVQLPSGEVHGSCTIGTHTVCVQGRTRDRVIELLAREVRLRAALEEKLR